MQVGDLVKLSIQGAINMGMMRDPKGYGTGVFLGMARGSDYIASVYWLGGYGHVELHTDFFDKIT